MTAEVAIMNQLAVVLAADSASTVTYWSKGQRERRYFKGANKLFQLSLHHPVGLMVFGSASVHGVPWEIIVKDFRAHRAELACDKLATYAEEFFNYVRAHNALFPQELRQKAFVADAVGSAQGALWHIQKNVLGVRFPNPAPPLSPSAPEAAGAGEAIDEQSKRTTEAKKALFDETLSKMLAKWTSDNPPEQFTAADIEGLLAQYAEAVAERLRVEAAAELIGFEDFIDRLAKLGMLIAVHACIDGRSPTGVVIAGYGEKDYFPSLEAFHCYGFVDDRLVIRRQDASSKAIGEDASAVIEPFAITSMVNTLRMGISPDVFDTMSEAVRTSHIKLSEAIRAAYPDAGIGDVTSIVNDAIEACGTELLQHSVKNHYSPLAHVVASLPVGDMAALAKSLIELQSLKERVTEPSESVAGPIDVAVISKHDGFVWIDRKHYFNPQLNPRFLKKLEGH